MKNTNIIPGLIFALIFLLITFFGMGPVLLADGSDRERLLTFLVVLLIYGVWLAMFLFWRKKRRRT